MGKTALRSCHITRNIKQPGQALAATTFCALNGEEIHRYNTSIIQAPNFLGFRTRHKVDLSRRLFHQSVSLNSLCRSKGQYLPWESSLLLCALTNWTGLSRMATQVISAPPAHFLPQQFPYHSDMTSSYHRKDDPATCTY